jgi:hypothetical protein
MATSKPRVIPISDDGGLGKIMSGEAFVAQYFPELLEKKPDVTTDPVIRDPVIRDPVKPDPPIITPPVEQKPFGWPRAQVGLREDKGRQLPVCLGPSLDYLLLIVNKPGEPDAFMPCGYNLGYSLLPNVATRPTGQETHFAVTWPASFVRPAGYRLRYFEDGTPFLEQSDLPDEAKPQPAMNLQPQYHESPRS